MPKRCFTYSRDVSKYSLLKQKQKNKNSSIQAADNEITCGNSSDEQKQKLSEGAEYESLEEKKVHLRYEVNDETERLLVQNSHSLQYVIDHSDFPAFNVGIWPQDGQELLDTYPTCAFSVPRPIYVAEGSQETIDLCFKRPMIKDFHSVRLSKTRGQYTMALKKKRTVRAEEKKGIYNTAVFDLAERRQVQPDPYFTGTYDYYYTGGNLCILPKTGNIVHASGENLQTLEISEFPMVEDYTVTTTLHSVAKHISPEVSEIFEVRPMLTSADRNRQNCFIVRQRNIVSLNLLNESRQLKILTQFRTKSTPFISFSQSERDTNKLLITTMKQHVRHYDIGDNVPRLVNLFEIKSNHKNLYWNTIKPWRENTFLYANENNFFLIDTRTTPDQWMPSASSANDHVYLCDRICSVMPSDFNNIFYVATNHKLHCMDIRHIKNCTFNEPEAAICRWAHQMQYAPLLMDTYRLRNNEYIALSSPLAGEMHICQLSRKSNIENLVLPISKRVPKHIYSSRCMPYQPPTLMEAYECARLAGKCLQPETKLKNRLQACTTGLSFSKPSLDGNGPGMGLLLTSNSVGDIFVHTLTKREGQEGDSRGNTRSTEIMAEFAEKLTQQEQTLHYSHIKNMKGMRKVFLCKYLNTKLKVDMDDMDDSFSENEYQLPNQHPFARQEKKKKRKRLHMGRWQKSFSTLQSYKDALVHDLLSIWDIEVDEGNTIRLGNLQSSARIKEDPSLKVRDWLDTNLNRNPPMTVIPPQEAAKYVEINNTTVEGNISMDLNEMENTMDFENAIQSTQIMETTMQMDTSIVVDTPVVNNINTSTLERTNTKKKSKKYVKGF